VTDDGQGTPDDLEPTAAVEPPPATGDQTVDAALDRLHERAESGTLDDQAEAAEETHRALQDRLADLGGD